jgi:hypothetical protein
MAKKPQRLQAEERSAAISKAIADWRKLAAIGAEEMLWRGGSVLWNEEHGYWSFFGKAKTNTALGWRWWNTFGRVPEAFQQNMLVEINPQQKGPAKGTQGLVAIDGAGRRWLLHGGGLRPPGRRVSADQFRNISTLATTPVLFSDGRLLEYFLVAPLDDGAQALHRSVAEFVSVCEDVRNEVLHGKVDADLERRVRQVEGSSTPERRGNYAIPSRPAGVAKRVHADVWKALARELDRRETNHSNRSVGRYGPDLRTRDKPLVLFEIKTDTTARSLYESLGQLLMYERLLGAPFTKVAVLPGPPPTDLGAVLKDMEVRIVTYRRTGRTYAFDPRTLGAVLGAK